MTTYKFILLTSDTSVANGVGATAAMVAVPTPLLGEPLYTYFLQADIQAASFNAAAETVRGWFEPIGAVPAGIVYLFETNSRYVTSITHPIEPKNAQVVALMNAAPGREVDFEPWHTDTHFPDVLAMPGWMGAQRFRLEDDGTSLGQVQSAPWRYLALYDLSAKDIPATVDYAFSRVGSPEIPLSDAAGGENLLAITYRLSVDPTATRV